MVKKNQKIEDDFIYKIDQFDDIKILRYKVPGFENLSLKQKTLVYYLSKAAICGRDIIYDQNFRHNLCIRRTLEAIINNYTGNKNSKRYLNFIKYTKKVWFSNGIHHHYSGDKFIPSFAANYFKELVKSCPAGELPLQKDETIDDLLDKIIPIMFNPEICSKKVSHDTSKDLIKSSSVNFYNNVSQSEVEEFYKQMRSDKAFEPVSYGLNSRVVKIGQKIIEKPWKVGGLYSDAIDKIIHWLENAKEVAENTWQKNTIIKLIDYYKTGDLKTWDEYNILWVKDLKSDIDFVNGFVEVYEDPIGLKGTWESVVNFKDHEATRRTAIISDNAQWFEDHSPVNSKFKKKKVRGISAKVITVAQLGGDCYPSTPIGINLPNSDWIRKSYGSKSVTLENITYAYDRVSLHNGFLEEFACSDEEIGLSEQYSYLGSNIHTDLHECLGHGSGQMLKGVTNDALKNYHSTMEEARADLFALYFIMDRKMIELGLFDSEDVARSEYNNFIRNGLMTQLVRIAPGKNIEEAHMRNRQLIAKWVYEKGRKEGVIEKKVKNGKTFFIINDFLKLRILFGVLLAEIQRIKSEGDYGQAKFLVETYGVIVDHNLHMEVKERYDKLKLSPYSGFINPVYVPVIVNNKITDIKINYPEDYMEQMLSYSKDYSYLPTYN